MIEPRARGRPVAHYGALRQFDCTSDVLYGHVDEVAELHDRRHARVLDVQAGERLVDGKRSL